MKAQWELRAPCSVHYKVNIQLTGQLIMRLFWESGISRSRWQLKLSVLDQANHRGLVWGWIGRCSVIRCLVAINRPWAGSYYSQVASHFGLCAFERLSQSYRNSAELSRACSGGILLAQIFRRDFTSGQWAQARRIKLLSGNRRESAWGWIGRCSIPCCPVVIHHPRTGGCSLQVASPANLIAIERSCQMYRSSAELMPACRWDDGMIERSGEVDV